jgi:formiminoglutamate deiminase
VVVAWASERAAPLHAHVSEQPAENEACLKAYGQTPTDLLASLGALGPNFTAVHATHLTHLDIELLGSSASSVCMCPTTERELADGIGPAAALRTAGSPLCLGSDSHAVINLFEEARAVELDERLATGRRGHHSPADLLGAATAGGAAALGWPDAGRLRPGALADFVTVRAGGPSMSGATDDRGGGAAAAAVFCATPADVTDVVVGGRHVVAGGQHQKVADVGRSLTKAIARVLAG